MFHLYILCAVKKPLLFKEMKKRAEKKEKPQCCKRRQIVHGYSISLDFLAYKMYFILYVK